jgi:hypothetical protein
MRHGVAAAPVAALLLFPVWARAQTTTCSAPAASTGTPSSTGTASGGFTTQNGQIIGPNGQPFQARGVDVMWGGDVPSASTLTQTFPGVNFVRLAIYNYPSPSNLSAYVNSLTSEGIVVELEDHNNGAGNAGGGQGTIFTGQTLTNELNWYSSIASYFANNPDVWFGTDNEPSEVNPATGQQDPAALSTWQQETYNAIRSTGNTSPVILEINASANNGQPQVAVGYTPSVYQGMTNVIGDIHFYGWLTGYSTDQTTNSNFLAQMIQDTHQLTTANGAIGEYGPSTTGAGSVDPNSRQVLDAVQSSGVGNVAWAYTPGTVGQDALLSSGGGLTSYGQEVQDYIASAANNCGGAPVIATTTPSATEPAIATSAPTATAPSVDTDPIDTTATNIGAQNTSSQPTTDTTPIPMGPAPTAAVASTDPATSAPVASVAAQDVVPTYGSDGSGNQTQTYASSLPSSSSNPSGDPTFSSAQGMPQQVVPKYGAGYVSGYASSGTGDTSTTGTDGMTAVTPVTYTPDSTDPADTPQLQTLLAQSYGQTAVSTADQLGVNPSSVAAIAQVESNFQNVGTANGSTTATGPWQFTQGTFNQVSQSNNLGFTPSELTNPNDQATEAAYYLQQIASTIGTATGQPATTLQTYAGWVFGPNAGANIANATSNMPLSSIVSAQSLANNGMSNWTVGQFNAAMSAKLGAAASQTVLTTQGT